MRFSISVKIQHCGQKSENHETEHQKVDKQNIFDKKPLNLILLKLQAIYSLAK